MLFSLNDTPKYAYCATSHSSWIYDLVSHAQSGSWIVNRYSLCFFVYNLYLAIEAQLICG